LPVVVIVAVVAVFWSLVLNQKPLERNKIFLTVGDDRARKKRIGNGIETGHGKRRGNIGGRGKTERQTNYENERLVLSRRMSGFVLVSLFRSLLLRLN